MQLILCLFGAWLFLIKDVKPELKSWNPNVRLNPNSKTVHANKLLNHTQTGKFGAESSDAIGKRFPHLIFENYKCRDLDSIHPYQTFPRFQPEYDIEFQPIDDVIYDFLPDDNTSYFPLAVHASLTYFHVVPHERTTFGPTFNPQMRYMNARGATYGGTGITDEKGHLVASQLRGPISWFNLAPQTARVNRNLGNAGIEQGWINIENRIRAHLDNDDQNLVDWALYMNYDFINNDARPGDNYIRRRPKGYKLCVEFFDRNFNPDPNMPPVEQYYDNEY